MKPADRVRLTAALREHVARIAHDLRAQMRTPGPVQDRARCLHRDEQVGDDFDVWTDLLSRRAAVLWVLKSVYVRVLEDRRLLVPGRLLDPGVQHLFERLAPHLGDTAFLQWVYRDLASRRGGLPELFTPQPAEVALPADDLSKALITFWRHEDPDTGACWSFAEERFEGELMGDLYQELDPVVKDRFALCQTPDFVREFILERTLTPAIETFGADTVRMVDPACGSGHFLIDGLKRLVTATAEQHPDWAQDRTRLVTHCLARVVGIDLNDYACALARARLVMTAAELAGVNSLADAAQFHPHVYWADGLEQVERAEKEVVQELDLFDVVPEPEVRAGLTRPEVKAVLRNVLAPKFHAVVANPPYIVERDDARKAYHREEVGGRRRYVSAYQKYSLSCPFVERSLQVALPQGYIGLITSNNFMKREFGRILIEAVLANVDLNLVVDTSQAHIPGHGTPTVLLFARNRRPAKDHVRAVMGKRGETSRPADPTKGRVWTSIVDGWNEVGFESEFVSVANVPRATFAKHPWSLGGGGAAELKDTIQEVAQHRLGDMANAIGIAAVIGEGQIFTYEGRRAQKRFRVTFTVPLVLGDDLRDWSNRSDSHALWPYTVDFQLRELSELSEEVRYLWPYRVILSHRKRFGTLMLLRGAKWYEWQELYDSKLRTPLTVVYAEIATHNHFVLNRGGSVFNRTAPVVKLSATATEDEHLALLGLLNSSTACFWMKQVFHAKAAGGIGRGLEPEPWMERYAHDSTKMKLFPIPAHHSAAVPFAARLDAIARQRTEASVASILQDPTASFTAPSLRQALAARREADSRALYEMVALQEELDWLCYRLYGLIPDTAADLAPTAADLSTPDAIIPCPPTWLPWALNLAQSDHETRAAIQRGEEITEIPTAWFERHRWTPVLELPDDAPQALRDKVERRRRAIAETPSLALIETATYKRRWYRPDYDADEKAALQDWMADMVETVAQSRSRAFTLEHLTAALQDNPQVLAVTEVFTGRRDFNLSQWIGQILACESVPSHPSHVYKPTGLVKRAAWEQTWADQRREDAGETVTPEVPPSYGSVDFLKNEYWQLRGKLDVPKERFIAFTEVPPRGDPVTATAIPGKRSGTTTPFAEDTLFGWAGWTPLQRMKALLAIDEDLEDRGVPLADRTGLLDSTWRLIPDAEREDAGAASRLKAELLAILHTEGPSREILADWRHRFPPPGTHNTRTRKPSSPSSG